MDLVYPSVGFYFQVKLDNEAYSFKEVSGISSEINTEEIAEGGENRFKYKVPTGIKYNNLELKRGLVPVDSPLYTWVRNTLEQGFAKAIETKSFTVLLLNEEGESVVLWNFEGVWPVGWNVASLNSMTNDVLIESITFSYNYFTTKITTSNDRNNQGTGSANSRS